MKNYIAPEMEIVKFKTVDILTASDVVVESTQITGTDTLSEALNASAAVNWGRNGAFN